ncbi:hypothetical protein HGH92_05195 [Chitinophaga varians]|uniref:Uncharacterized protein n=1 Tax=Chitinophaga varians TaxID=2202339 RepID=A0A847RSD3_9BACT|nr:hypothetical protein [Chitinophaga varians]NLR63697.1 hypothetical protein [Chitinophaga varians]
MKKLIATAFIVICLVFACNMFSAGSFPYAEIYQYKTNKDSLIYMFELLKISDSSILVPEGYGFDDGLRDASGHWYYIYFYNKRRDEIMLTWVREGIDNTYTNFAFVAVKRREDVGNWKNINKDFDRSGNKARKAEFKALILDRLPIVEN